MDVTVSVTVGVTMGETVGVTLGRNGGRNGGCATVGSLLLLWLAAVSASASAIEAAENGGGVGG